MYCKNCGVEMPDDADVCTSCGAQVKPLETTYTNPIVVDEPSAGLNVLSFFLPVVGLILYLVYMDTTPKRAKKIGKFAIIGACVGFVLSILFVVVLPMTLFMFYGVSN
jgi:Kef-type K+ transport system membrane component KefB